MLAVASAAPASRGRLQVVDQGRDVQRRMDVGEKVHMVGFAAELQQLAAPFGEDLAEGVAKVVEQLRREGLTPVLGHKNNVQPKLEYGVRRRPMRLLTHAA